jgi:predicted delta-1-pyrroline-5-carboxylate dehydrogenase group 2
VSFSNEPILELRRAPIRAGLAPALAKLDAQLPIKVPVILGGQRQPIADPFTSNDPGLPARIVAQAATASPAQVDDAVRAAAEAGREWASRSVEDRAAALRGAAAWMRTRRLELAALILREAGKPWAEADADVCEAIDFLEYYARGAVLLAAPRPLEDIPGERNELHYVARGVTAVIAPWNFPLAIACGMSAAAIVTGNAVVLKPAEQSPACALALVDALLAGGVPAGVISLLPGAGETGAALVAHPDVQTIAFTGSQTVGLEIVRSAAEMRPGQNHIKRIVAELGGKNCVIVAADADLDEAVPAIVGSAFAYAGQKCSAAARVLVEEAVALPLIERLRGAVSVLTVGRAEDLTTQVPALIEADAQARLRAAGDQARHEGTVVIAESALPAEGYFVAPTLVSALPSDSDLLTRELFGPLLCVEVVADIEAACRRVDELPVALTGGLFSRNPQTVAAVRSQTPVGNFYVNRMITGAIVGRHPFGGNRLSGTGAKAGGPDYLLQFVEPRAYSENTMRHGLAI